MITDYGPPPHSDGHPYTKHDIFTFKLPLCHSKFKCTHIGSGYVLEAWSIVSEIGGSKYQGTDTPLKWHKNRFGSKFTSNSAYNKMPIERWMVDFWNEFDGVWKRANAGYWIQNKINKF